MMYKTLIEATGTLFLIYMLIHEQDLITFEQNAARKLRRIADRVQYRIWSTIIDMKAIRRACRRQNITARELWRQAHNAK